MFLFSFPRATVYHVHVGNTNETDQFLIKSKSFKNGHVRVEMLIQINE